MSSPIRSAEQFGIDTSGFLCGFFPIGTHVFPASAATVLELHEALAEAFREIRLVSPEQIEKHRELQQRQLQRLVGGTDAGADTFPRLGEPFRFDALRAFLARHRPAFQHAVQAMRASIDARVLASMARAFGLSRDELIARLGSAVCVSGPGTFEVPARVKATLARAAPRLRRIKAMNFPEPVVAHETTNALRIADEKWSFPTVDFDAEIPDEIYPASIIDAESWLKRQGRLPVVGADISGLVLLAAQCCVPPEAEAIGRKKLGKLTWQSFGGGDLLEQEVRDVPPGFIAVRPNVSNEAAVFSFALVTATQRERADAPEGALVRVTMYDPEDYD